MRMTDEQLKVLDKDITEAAKACDLFVVGAGPNSSSEYMQDMFVMYSRLSELKEMRRDALIARKIDDLPTL